MSTYFDSLKNAAYTVLYDSTAGAGWQSIAGGGCLCCIFETNDFETFVVFLLKFFLYFKVLEWMFENFERFWRETQTV